MEKQKKIVIEDTNAKVGREEDFRHITGGKSLHKESNENGKMLIEFAEENKMKIISTHFDHKNIHKETWTSSYNKTKNQIDHLLIENRDHTMIHDCRSYRGADANSDHTLVIAKIKEKLPTNRKLKKERKRVNVEILKDKKITQQIERELNKD